MIRRIVPSQIHRFRLLSSLQNQYPKKLGGNHNNNNVASLYLSKKRFASSIVPVPGKEIIHVLFRDKKMIVGGGGSGGGGGGAAAAVLRRRSLCTSTNGSTSQKRTSTSSTSAKKSNNNKSKIIIEEEAAAAVPVGGGTGYNENCIVVIKMANKYGIRLTSVEAESLTRKLDLNGDGKLSFEELSYAGRQALEERYVREIFLSVLEKPEMEPMTTTSSSVSSSSTLMLPSSFLDRLGVRIISFLDYAGTALFAIVGTQAAGDAGMNIVGCCLVGCVASMGGGTVNGLIYGGSSQLLSKPGAFWVRNPHYLMVALGASVVTFFLWPIYCRSKAEHYIRDIIGVQNLDKDGTINRQTFVHACLHNQEFFDNLRVAFAHEKRNDNFRKHMEGEIELIATEIAADRFFDDLDIDKSGSIDRRELEVLARKTFDNCYERYVIDTAALAAFSVCGVHGAIQLGLHPLVAASSAVTSCFGGIFRDVFCRRQQIAMAGQSYAFATGAGASVYLLIRELGLRNNIRIPLIAKILTAVSTTVGLRVCEYLTEKPILAPMI